MMKKCARLLGLLAVLPLSLAPWYGVWLVISPAFGQQPEIKAIDCAGLLNCTSQSNWSTLPIGQTLPAGITPTGPSSILRDVTGPAGSIYPLPKACYTNMPCGDTTTEEDLRLAAAYCEHDLLTQFCDGRQCAPIPRDLFPRTGWKDSARYTTPACSNIVKRWEKSKWKAAQDAEQKREKDAEIAREKAFVDAVAKQKPGTGEK